MASIICFTDISWVPMAASSLTMPTFSVWKESPNLFGTCSVLVLCLLGTILFCPLRWCIHQHISVFQFVVFSHQQVAEELVQEAVVLAYALGNISVVGSNQGIVEIPWMLLKQIIVTFKAYRLEVFDGKDGGSSRSRLWGSLAFIYSSKLRYCCSSFISLFVI